MTHPPLKDQILALVHRYTGGRVGYADGNEVTNPAADLTHDLAPVTTADILRQMAPKPRGSLAPLYETLEDLSRRAHANIDESTAGTNATAGPLFAHTAAGLGLDVPASAARFASKGIDYLRGQPEATELFPSNYVDAALMAAPYARGPVKEGIRETGAFLKSPVGRTAAAGAAAALGFEPVTAQSPTNDPRLKEVTAKQEQIERLSKQLGEMGKQYFPSTPARLAATKPLQDQIDAAQRRIEQLHNEMRADEKERKKEADRQQSQKETDERERRSGLINEARDARDEVLRNARRPFSETFPNASAVWPFAPLIAGGVTGLLLGGAKATSNQAAKLRWDSMLNKAERTTSPANREMYTKMAEEMAGNWPAQEKGWLNAAREKMPAYTGPMTIGAIEGGAIPNLSKAYNLTLDDENPDRRAMQKYYRGLTGLPENDEEVVRTKKLLGDEDALPRGYAPKQEAVDYFTDPIHKMFPQTAAGAFEGAAATMPGTTAGIAFSPWDKTLAVRRARTEALKARRPPGPSEPPGGGGAPTPPPLPEFPASYREPPQLPPPLPEAPVPALKAPRPDEAITLPTTDTPPVSLPDGYSWHESGKGSKVKDEAGRWAVAPKGAKKKAQTPKAEPEVDPALEYFKDDSKLTRGQANGGAIELARRYASGGAVINHGFMGGDTPGRADHLDVDVRNGAFVVPADCVSGAPGAGNSSKAGAAWWASVLPKAGNTLARADGGEVPIRISDGEYVVSPEQVMVLGNGNMEQGHRILEALIKRIRTQNIQHLASLPGPARD